jgi:large subunit ribosomal protein L15
MKLNEIGRPEGNKKPKVRKGRGPGTGNGKTAGRGSKGQLARSGAKHRAWFEGGQMPINRRVPKRGFKNPFAKSYQLVNLRDLARFADDANQVNATTLWEVGLVKSPDLPVKLLGDGQVSRAFTVEVDKASKSAAEAIQSAGGQITVKQA